MVETETDLNSGKEIHLRRSEGIQDVDLSAEPAKRIQEEHTECYLV